MIDASIPVASNSRCLKCPLHVNENLKWISAILSTTEHLNGAFDFYIS